MSNVGECERFLKLRDCEVYSLEPECIVSDCRPCRSIHNREILETQSQDYMYLACVRFVKQARSPHCSRRCFCL